MNISLIGYGNVAHALSKALIKADHKILSIHGRDLSKRSTLAELLNAKSLSITESIPKETDIVIIAVKDDAISEVSKSIKVSDKNQIICHTSGSVAMTDIRSHNPRGVLYPLQTFSKSREIEFKYIPMCLNGNDRKALTQLEKLAKSISQNIFILSDDERKQAHLAAVLINNFTNFIVSEAYEMLDDDNIPIRLVQPLLSETCKKLLETPPDTTQTGPAKRNDQKVIDAHLKLIKKDSLKELYKTLSYAIANKYKSNENNR